MCIRDSRYTPTIIVEGESAAVPPPPAPLVIRLLAQRRRLLIKLFPTWVRSVSFLRHVLIYFIQLICLSYDSGTETAREPRAEAVREQENAYDPLFTYKEGDEASYFVFLEDSRGDGLTSVLQVLGPRKGVPWLQAL